MGPAQQAITANSVPGEDLPSAISLQAAGNNVLRVGGPALAAPILAAWGAPWAFTVYAVTNVLMVLVLLSIQVSRRVDEPSRSSMWQQWIDGLRHARERRPAVTALTSMAVLSMFGVSYVALVPVFTVDVLHHPRDDFTTLVIAQGLGAVVGALAIGFRRRPLTIVTAEAWLFSFSLALGGFSLARSWTLALVLNAIVGFCYFSATTTINTLVQQLADDDKRGRLMSLFNLAWAGFVPLGGIWMGTVADAGGAPLTVQIGAGVCFVFSLSALARYSTAPPR
jgi:predicted MFS family arabinose efflux permease